MMEMLLTVYNYYKAHQEESKADETLVLITQTNKQYNSNFWMRLYSLHIT